MVHETGLIATIAMALTVAFIGGFVATRLRLPAIVGYLLAGVAVGPFTPGFVADEHVAAELAEIGVILLMFGVGIHFSLRELWDVRAIALPGAFGQIAFATALGTGLALVWGWSLGSGIVLGLAISVASTVVLLRALMERDAMATPHGRAAIGWLIVEDLFTVLVLVLLPALAGSLGADPAVGGEAVTAVPVQHPLIALGIALGKVAVLTVLMLVVGTRVIPWLLVQVTHTGSRELFTLAVLAVALGIAFGSAVLFGASLALGAFLAGLVVGESDLSHQAAADALPLRDAFAVLFFVSVGMLIDPSFLLSHTGPLLAILAAIVLGKGLVALLIVSLLGHPLRTGLTVAAGLAQIGEFSFILGSFGLSLGLLPEEGYSLILAAALLSITINPLLFRGIDPLEAWLRRRPRLLALLERRGPGLAEIVPSVAQDEPRGHALICGYGRVGRVIGEALQRRGLAFTVVEQDRRRVEDLRRGGIPALFGDASNPQVLEHSGLAQARLLVIAIPDAPTTRLVAELAHQAHPGLAIVARTHSEEEWRFLRAGLVSEAVLGERELAIEMTRYALDCFEVPSPDLDAIINELRNPAPA